VQGEIDPLRSVSALEELAAPQAPPQEASDPALHSLIFSERLP
jgi:hypothetical protein